MILIPAYRLTSRFALLCLSSLFLTSASLASECIKQKDQSKSDFDFSACMTSSQLKWALSAEGPMTPEQIRKGPEVKPELSRAEQESGTIFCRYVAHQFSSPGSAKFKCARTTSDGTLLDAQGIPVPAAKNVSTDSMKISVTVQGVTRIIGEGYLLDEKNRPLRRLAKDQSEKLIEADEFKVKYFVDISDSSKMRKRQTYEFVFDGRPMTLQNAFVGPTEITTPRWNEVFTEVASTRLLWALGYPADIMIPLSKVICFGCEAHAKEQKIISPSEISVYHFAVIERKSPGTKLADFFNMNSIYKNNFPNWNSSIQNDFEGLALISQLIGYHNFINLQNRLQCAPGQLIQIENSDAKVCSSPIPLMQDVGSTWAGRVTANQRLALGLNDNPRGNIQIYEKIRVFSEAQSCQLTYSMSSHIPSEQAAGPGLTHVSKEAVESLRLRLKNLSTEGIRAIFEVARFGDMEPALRNSLRGQDMEEKRKVMIERWTEALEKKIHEINSSNCPERRRLTRTDTAKYRFPANTEESKTFEIPKLNKKIFKNLTTEQRDRYIREARVTRADFNARDISQFDILENLKKSCGAEFQYGLQGAAWPQLSCTYQADEKTLGGYSSKFLCDFAASKDSQRRVKKVKYSRSRSQPLKSEVIETIVASTLTQLIGFYTETYCPVVIQCVGCPSQDPWSNDRASAKSLSDATFRFPWAIVEKEIKSVTLASEDSYPRSQGLGWDEIRKVQTSDAELNRQMRIEREAWVLWMNFIHASDAHNSNQRLSCLDAKIDGTGRPVCHQSIMYSHDFGHSFLRHFQFAQWKDIPALVNQPQAMGCKGTFDYPYAEDSVKGLVLSPMISSEARDLLLIRLNQITDSQLEVIYNLAQMNQVAGISLQTWIQTLRRKMNELQSASCLGIDTIKLNDPGASILSL